MTPQQLLPVLVPLVVLGVIFLRARRPRQVRLELLWISPLAITALIAAGVAAQPHRAPFTLLDFGVFALAVAAGAGIGWLRAKATRLTVDPQTHEVTSATSPIGLMIIVAVFLVRFGLRSATVAEAGASGLDPAVIADAFLLLAAGLVVGQRVEIFLRARRLIAAAQPAKFGAA